MEWYARPRTSTCWFGPHPRNIQRLRAALRAAFANDPTVEEIRAEDLLGDYPAVRYYPPRGDLYLNVMTRLGEESELRLGGVRVTARGTAPWPAESPCAACSSSGAWKRRSARVG